MIHCKRPKQNNILSFIVPEQVSTLYVTQCNACWNVLYSTVAQKVQLKVSTCNSGPRNQICTENVLVPYEKMKTMESPKIPFLELDLPILNKKKREVAQSLNTMAKISYSPSCLKTCAWWLYFQATILFLFRPLDIGNLLTSFFLVHLSLFFCCCFRPLELWMPHSSPA